MTSGGPLGDIWDTFGKHLGCIWGTVGGLLGDVFETFGEPSGDLWGTFGRHLAQRDLFDRQFDRRPVYVTVRAAFLKLSVVTCLSN